MDGGKFLKGGERNKSEMGCYNDFPSNIAICSVSQIFFFPRLFFAFDGELRWEFYNLLLVWLGK